MAKSFPYHPSQDGKDHINVYSKGQTEIGKLLTNFAHTPFESKKHGHFESVEGYWYWRTLSKTLPETELSVLRKLVGFKAKDTGKKLKEKAIQEFGEIQKDNEFQEDILEAIRCKLRQNKDVLNKLCETNLPLTHYYSYGAGENPKIMPLPQYDWMIDEISRIRMVTQDYLKNKKVTPNKMKP
jgi:hypothetical protein